MPARPAAPQPQTEAVSIAERFKLAFSRLFTHLSPRETDELLSRATLIECEAGEFIVYEGASCAALYVIVEGEAKVLKREYMQHQHERMVELARLGLGSIIGEMSFLDGDVASASVLAELPTKLYRIDRSVVLELIERSPSFSTNFYRSLAGILSRRLRVANAVLSAKHEQRAVVHKEQYRIFVVDDDPEVLKFVTLFLENAGHTVRSAAGAMEGLSQIKQFRPDLILVDLMMPGLNGLDFCREIRRQADFAHMKIVLTSVRQEAYWTGEALAAGASGFIMKPLNPETIVTQIEQVMANNRPAATNSRAA
jgi:CheY-like chemotaxis protein